LEEFGASGLTWGRIEEGIIVEELKKHLVNAAPGMLGIYKIFVAFGCLQKALKTLFDTPTQPPDFLENAYYDT
jgi:hypothetical protein